MSPGSFTTDSTEIYQEGLQFPNVKIWSRGERNDALVDLIASNVRTPEQTIGDLMAQAAAMRVGERAFREVCDKYGIDVVLETIEALIDARRDAGAARAGEAPEGRRSRPTTTSTTTASADGPFEIRVKITITDDEFICDFTGSHPQVPGPVNNTFDRACSPPRRWRSRRSRTRGRRRTTAPSRRCGSSARRGRSSRASGPRPARSTGRR